MRPFHFMVAVWGSQYRSYLLDYCIPSLLVNDLTLIPKDSALLIATTIDDWNHILRDKNVVTLSRILRIRHFPLEAVPYAEANVHSAKAFARMTTEALEARAIGVFFCPDYFLACDMLEYIEQAIASGIEALVFPGPRISREFLDLELPVSRTVSMRDMERIAAHTLHPEALAYEWTSAADLVHSGHIWKRNKNGGMTFHCLTWSPLMLDYAALPTHNPASLQEEMLDGRYVMDNMTAINTKAILSGIPLLAFQEQNAGPQIPTSNSDKSAFGRWLCHSGAIFKTLELPHVGEVNRRLFVTPAYWNGANETFINAQSFLTLPTFSLARLAYLCITFMDWWNPRYFNTQIFVKTILRAILKTPYRAIRACYVDWRYRHADWRYRRVMAKLGIKRQHTGFPEWDDVPD